MLAAPYLLSAAGNGLRVAGVMWAGDHYGIEWKDTTPWHGLLGTMVCWGVLLGIWLLSDRRALRETLS
jgi:exosortase/archaeosortase family protein